MEINVIVPCVRNGRDAMQKFDKEIKILNSSRLDMQECLTYVQKYFIGYRTWGTTMRYPMRGVQVKLQNENEFVIEDYHQGERDV